MIWLLFLVIVAALVVAGAWYLRSQGGSSAKSMLFRPKPEKRLAFVEQMSIDGRRKVLLVRRDDVEHLIMIGGPVDVVIETGIRDVGLRDAGAARTMPGAARDGGPPVYTRQPRTLGQPETE